MADVFQGYFSSRTKNDFFWKNTRLSLMFVGGPKYRIIEGPGCFTKSRKELHKGWVIYCYWLSSYPMKLCQVQRCLSPALMFLHGVLLRFITETVIVPVHYDVLKVLKSFLKWINSIKYWQGCGLTRTFIYCFTVTLENYVAVPTKLAEYVHTLQPHSSTPRQTASRMYMYVYKRTHSAMFTAALICSYLQLGSYLLPTKSRMNKLIVIYSYEGLSRWRKGWRTRLQCRGRKRHRFNLWVGKIPWRRAWHPTPVFLPGESHGHRSLVGCSP